MAPTTPLWLSTRLRTFSFRKHDPPPTVSATSSNMVDLSTDEESREELEE